MDARQPQMRHRGFFLHSSDGEPDTGEHENPEGFIVRVRFPRNRGPRRTTSGRSHRTDDRVADSQPSIRSGSVTGSRQRAHLHR
jgi:hypothetical protein